MASIAAQTTVAPGRTGSRLRAVMKGAREAPLVAIVLLGGLILVAVSADLIAPHDPTRPVRGANVFDPPFWMEGGNATTPLGTDFLGRDILSRLIYGARVSLIVGLMGTLVAGSIGTALGIVSGDVGGWVDQIIMRVTDAWLALPAIVFAIFLAAMVGPSMWNIIVILGAVYWTRYARVIRGEVLTLRERDFVKLAEIAGASKLRVIKKHILPNVMNTATVLASLTVGVVIIAEASLSFLGVGVPPPQPAWGLMLSEARSTLMAGQWWLTVFPGFCILLIVLATQLFGDWLRVRPWAARTVGGRVVFEGEDLTRKSQRELRRIRGRRIAVILQDPMASLNPLFTIFRQVAEPAFFHQQLRGRTLRERVQHLLRAVRIPSPEWRMREYPHQMSGGMRQRIVGAIALAGGPRVVIADEPTTNLDVTIQAQYLDLLKDIQRETGVALIFVTHNLGIVAKMCDRVAVMYAGKIIEQAPVRELFDHPGHPYTRALLGSVPRLGSKEPL